MILLLLLFSKKKKLNQIIIQYMRQTSSFHFIHGKIHFLKFFSLLFIFFVCVKNIDTFLFLSHHTHQIYSVWYLCFLLSAQHMYSIHSQCFLQCFWYQKKCFLYACRSFFLFFQYLASRLAYPVISQSTEPKTKTKLKLEPAAFLTLFFI